MLRLLICALISASLAGCVSAPVQDPAQLPAGAWALDPAHASTVWRIRHMGLSWYTGRFDEIDARLDFDPARPQDAQLTAIINAASISTGDRAFDATLCGGGWFACEAHPQIIFTSDRIEVTGADTGRIHGQLQLKGVTQAVVLETQFYGGLFNPLERRQALGFGADMTINRTDFGVGRLPGNLIGDTVVVRIEAEFLRDQQE
ncbi:YceI family protein [Oceanicaulis sp. MMSF_3324]|uniref:YceI family protein n=1 Tax=Oceanicaulis sp. MMSF_3324 TaxID=3046702 RepID=UPI00273ED493|nr:YceI family protein [Oceanicaulis sp. MMSF_3324]